MTNNNKPKVYNKDLEKGGFFVCLFVLGCCCCCLFFFFFGGGGGGGGGAFIQLSSFSI